MILEVPAGVIVPCRQEDPEKWFPETDTGRTSNAIEAFEEAKAVCRTCPLVDECLMVALVNDDQNGVWGGLSPDERRAVRQQMRGRGWFKSAA